MSPVHYRDPPLGAGALLEQLQQATEAGVLRPLDLAFSRFLVEQCPATPAEVVLAVALLCQRNSQGHVCLDLTRVLHSPETFFGGDETLLAGTRGEAVVGRLCRLLAGLDLSLWLEQLRGSDLVETCWQGQASARITPLVLAGTPQRPLLYLRRYWQYELDIRTAIGLRLQQHCALLTAPTRTLLDGLFSRTESLQGSSPDWQKIACALAAGSPFAIITGGPGTGKTTTVLRLLALLQGLQMQSGQPFLTIRLVAPTGKAAARLNQSIAGNVQRLDLQGPGAEDWRAAIPTEVSTLHRLLGSRPGSRRFRHHRGNPLTLDLVVVDEASMVDVELMARLLAALPPQARLILLGDKDQLASVEAGSVLGDLCQGADAGHYWPKTGDWIEQLSGERLADERLLDPAGSALAQATVMLRHSYRFASHPGIGELAQWVNSGRADVAGFKAICQRHARSDQGSGSLDYLELTSREATDALQATIVTGYLGYLEQIEQSMPARDADPMEWDHWALRVFAAHGRFQLLAAVRQGPLGVEGLNLLAYSVLRRTLQQSGSSLAWPDQPPNWYLGRPVLINRNNYGLKLMNGDVGICLQRPAEHAGGGIIPLVAFSVEDRVRWVMPSRLQNLETVFAMTVHKSQGSEFDHSALVLPDRPSPVLTKELLYTGITRSRSRFTLACGNDSVLQHCLQSRVERASGLKSVI